MLSEVGICFGILFPQSRIGSNRQNDYRSSALSTSQRRGIQALQRAAEKRLFGCDLFSSPLDDPNGAGYVAGIGCIIPRLGRYLFRAAICKDNSLCYSLGTSFVCDHSRVHGNRQRLLEQYSLDVYRILQSQTGGRS